MFKLSSRGMAKLAAAGSSVAESGRERPRGTRLSATAAILSASCLMLLVGTGCMILFHPLPPADLNEPGWEIRTGQAVWRLPHGETELAGDLLIATCSNHRAFLQFTKSPFPLLVAQENASRWEVALPSQNKRYAGKGAPPKRLIWLYLPRILQGAPAPKGWTWHLDADGWQLENAETGESLEGFFIQ